VTFSQLDAKYGVGESSSSGQVKRVKIFDDDESDVDEAGERPQSGSDDEDTDENDDEDEDEDDDEDDMDEDEDEDEEEDEDEDDEEEEYEETSTRPSVKSSVKSTQQASLDPIAAIKASKAKDIEKGRAIKRQQVCRCPLALDLPTNADSTPFTIGILRRCSCSPYLVPKSLLLGLPDRQR
jgi:protein AATF/BFR2